MKKVFIFLIAGSVLSGVAAYAAIARPAIPASRPAR
jgi:hypothetical protein